MAYENCPNCGIEKHVVNKCTDCGFVRLAPGGTTIFVKRRITGKAKKSDSHGKIQIDRPSANKGGEAPRNPVGGDWMACPICRARVRPGNLPGHKKRAHSGQMSKRQSRKAKKKDRSRKKRGYISDLSFGAIHSAFHATGEAPKNRTIAQSDRRAISTNDLYDLLGRSSDSSAVSKIKCQHCGRPAIQGDSVCYACSSD